jgi:hypothetical protein
MSVILSEAKDLRRPGATNWQIAHGPQTVIPSEARNLAGQYGLPLHDRNINGIRQRNRRRQPPVILPETK